MVGLLNCGVSRLAAFRVVPCRCLLAPDHPGPGGRQRDYGSPAKPRGFHPGAAVGRRVVESPGVSTSLLRLINSPGTYRARASSTAGRFASAFRDVPVLRFVGPGMLLSGPTLDTATTLLAVHRKGISTRWQCPFRGAPGHCAEAPGGIDRTPTTCRHVGSGTSPEHLPLPHCSGFPAPEHRRQLSQQRAGCQRPDDQCATGKVEYGG